MLVLSPVEVLVLSLVEVLVLSPVEVDVVILRSPLRRSVDGVKTINDTDVSHAGADTTTATHAA